MLTNKSLKSVSVSVSLAWSFFCSPCFASLLSLQFTFFVRFYLTPTQFASTSSYQITTNLLQLRRPLALRSLRSEERPHRLRACWSVHHFSKTLLPSGRLLPRAVNISSQVYACPHAWSYAGRGRNHACTSRNKATNFHVMHQEGEAAGGLGAAPLAPLKNGQKRRERPESYCAPPGPETGRAGEGVQRAAVNLFPSSDSSALLR